jgi:hypothetical protein
MELLVGIALVLFGAAALTASLGIISSLVYPIIWWGIIFLIDAVNFKKWGSSLIHSDHKHFFLVLFPLSALFWLYYEFINLTYPQWIYLGIVPGFWIRVALSVVSFSTVIPIIVELFWFFIGPVEMPKLSTRQTVIADSHAFPIFVTGAIFTILPFFSNIFYLNQMMWVGPAFMCAPFLISPEANFGRRLSIKKFFAGGIGVGLLSGILWEFLNFWAGGKWQYIILPESFRIFEMPVYGYIGFIPFAFSTILLYLFAKSYLPAKPGIAIPLWVFIFVASYVFVLLL